MKRRAWIMFFAVLFWTSTASAAEVAPVLLYSDSNMEIYGYENELNSAPIVHGYMDRAGFSTTLTYHFKTDAAKAAMIDAAKKISKNYKTFVMVPDAENNIAFVNYEVRFYLDVGTALILKETFLDSTGMIIAWRDVSEVAYLTPEDSPILSKVSRNLISYFEKVR